MDRRAKVELFELTGDRGIRVPDKLRPHSADAMDDDRHVLSRPISFTHLIHLNLLVFHLHPMARSALTTRRVDPRLELLLRLFGSAGGASSFRLSSQPELEGQNLDSASILYDSTARPSTSTSPYGAQTTFNYFDTAVPPYNAFGNCIRPTSAVCFGPPLSC
jgi:hypothetical protein